MEIQSFCGSFRAERKRTQASTLEHTQDYAQSLLNHHLNFVVRTYPLYNRLFAGFGHY